jgi:hypothetical protein
MTHFDQATSRAGERVMAAAGLSVTLKRGASSATFTAARSRRPSQDLSEENFQTTSDKFRFLIKCSDYKVEGVEVLPSEGDKIEEVTGGKKFTWEVLKDGSTRCWDYFDTGNVYLWARVKEHKTETA